MAGIDPFVGCRLGDLSRFRRIDLIRLVAVGIWFGLFAGCVCI